MMIKWQSALIGVIILLGGCSIKSSPPVDEYMITLELDQIQSAALSSKCHSKSVKLLEPFGDYTYTTNDLHYVIFPNQENSYNLSAWSHSIAGMLYGETLRMISKSKVFGSVANYSSVAKSEYILEMEINDFKQYFSSDLKHSYVLADLTFTLVETKRFRIIAQKEFVKKVDVKSLDAKGGVEALNTAFNEIIPNVLAWLSGVCR